MKQPRHIRIFLSSPGDVADERNLALQVIDQLPHRPTFRDQITLRPVAWDKPGAGTPMIATMSPQEAINTGLPRPSECDIVVVLFWARMGTPLSQEYVKPDGSRYWSGTEWEYWDAFQASKKTGSPIVVVYRRTEKVLLDDEAPDYEQRLEQKRRVKAFFDGFVNPDGSIKQGYNTYEKPEEFRQHFESHLEALLLQLMKSDSDATGKRPINQPAQWHGSPFLGLQPFTEQQAPIFFGRGRETDALIKRIQENRFVAVIGASGSGKSSLVGAGLIPRLKANAIEGSKDWCFLSFRPGEIGENPFDALSGALLKNLPNLRLPLANLIEQRQNLGTKLYDSATLTEPCMTLAEICDNALKDNFYWAEVVLFIDQFEELFTLGDASYTTSFIKLIAGATQSTRCRIIVTMRADFYHRAVDDPLLAELLQYGSFPLAAPDQLALIEMIKRPAERAGLHFEDGLDEQIVRDTGNEPGNLALMAYTLDELYHLSNRKDTLTYEVYESLGGVQGAIGTRAEKVFSLLPESVQQKLPIVFRHLVEVSDKGLITRQPVSVESLGEDSDCLNLVSALTEARLLVQNTNQNLQPVIEIAHEALLYNWPRLKVWLDSISDDLYLLYQLRQAVYEWIAHKQHSDYLWRGERLKQVHAMLLRIKPELNDLEKDFVRPEVERLLDELSDETISHVRRAKIGDLLDEVGDDRKGVGLLDNGLPDILWCFVPAGKILLEETGESFEVLPFYMSAYHVTWTQFRVFRESEDGYVDNMWWEELAERPDNPAYQQLALTGNRPVDNVCWYEAVAFTRWLSKKLDYEVRLPTEWEWQQAATLGDPQRWFPWGAEENPNFAKTDISGPRRSVAVGIYLKDISPVGVFDLAGNVRDWCLNEFTPPYTTNTDGTEVRAVRGGAWYNDLTRAYTNHRHGTRPIQRFNSFGFRLVTTRDLANP